MPSSSVVDQKTNASEDVTLDAQVSDCLYSCGLTKCYFFQLVIALEVLGHGALTKQGHAQVRQILARMNVAGRFLGETMLFLTLLFLLIVYVAYSSLDSYYLDKGAMLYTKGQLSDAEEALLQGRQLNPDDVRFSFYLGKVYESLGMLDKAVEEYVLQVESGSVCGLNAIGRSHINRINPSRVRPTLLWQQHFFFWGCSVPKPAVRTWKCSIS